ncbi:MAG TPA: LPS export ABC transporter periplasmic protein LptC [Steroidobacteraceae bacterium]
MIFRIIATFVLLVLVAGSLFLGRQQREAETPARAALPSEDLGYGARDAQLIETGADGRPKYTVNAKLIEEHPKDGSVELQTVHMILNDTGGNAWTVDAQHGAIVGNGDDIDLSGNVHVAGLLPGTDAPADIASERLSFDTHTQVVTSAAPVTLSWAGRQVHAIGIVANLKDSQVQLESAVHGIFQP